MKRRDDDWSAIEREFDKLDAMLSDRADLAKIMAVCAVAGLALFTLVLMLNS